MSDLPKTATNPFPGTWRIGLASLAVFAFAFGIWFAWRAWHPSALAKASRAYEQGDWPSALRLGREALKTSPDDPDASRLVARASTRLGRDDAAIGLYRKLGEATLESVDRLCLGLSLLRKGKPDEAKAAWHLALDGNPANAGALEDLGWFLFGKHLYEDALEVAHHLAELPGPRGRGGLLLGNLGARLNDIPGSSAAFGRAMQHDPESIERSSDPKGLRKLMARIFLRDDRADLALKVLGPLPAGPADPELSWLLSRAYLRSGDDSGARESLARSASYRADHPLENDPGPYVGEARCEGCHPKIFKDSLAHRHSQGYYRGDQILTLPRPDKPLADPDNPRVTHAVVEQGGTLREKTSVGDKVYEAVIEYAFGTRDRYVTGVIRDERGDYRIARMSYYQTADDRGWDRSALDSIHPTAGNQFQGELVGVRDGVIKCLYCHATNPRTGENRVGPETADRAVGCERCHGPGGNHVLAIERKFPDMAIVNAAHASPSIATEKQCNDCHILDRSFPESDPKLPAWIRSQGVGWTMSRCNTESAGNFGCTTCHDPHKTAASTTTEQYEAKCLSCHSKADSKPVGHRREEIAAKSSVCPVDASKGCLGCHMPKTRIEALHLDLSDHYIRVHRESPRKAAANPVSAP